jgi:hypothetical protein
MSVSFIANLWPIPSSRRLVLLIREEPNALEWLSLHQGSRW